MCCRLQANSVQQALPMRQPVHTQRPAMTHPAPGMTHAAPNMSHQSQHQSAIVSSHAERPPVSHQRPAMSHQASGMRHQGQSKSHHAPEMSHAQKPGVSQQGQMMSQQHGASQQHSVAQHKEQDSDEDTETVPVMNSNLARIAMQSRHRHSLSGAALLRGVRVPVSVPTSKSTAAEDTPRMQSDINAGTAVQPQPSIRSVISFCT